MPKEGVPVMECGSVPTVAWDPSRELRPGLQPSAVQTQAQRSLLATSFIQLFLQDKGSSLEASHLGVGHRF